MHHETQCYCDLILDSITEGVFTVDLDLHITSINRAAETIIGISHERAIGLPLTEALPIERCPIAQFLRKSVNTGTESMGLHVRLPRPSNKEIPLSLNIALLRDRSAVIVGAAATFRDLSAQEGLQRKIRGQSTFHDIISSHHRMQELFRVLPDIAESDSNVLIEGPSGSGKELFARAIHHLSNRRQHKMIAVNCGALPDALLESELFGYVKGAFTDARTDKPGRFALADKSTIFLDEIGDISTALQVKLLRVLQEKEYEPLGGTRTIKTDVRIVAASNKTLMEEVARGKFREDLYFRLNVVKLTLPSLAERREDIPLLIEHFIAHYNALKSKSIQGLADRAMDRLMRYAFPGNIRELQNIIEHAFILCHGLQIDLQHLPPHLLSSPTEMPAATPAPITDAASEGGLRRLEGNAIQAALQKHGGHRGNAARELGIDKSTLWRKMKKYAIS